MKTLTFKVSPEEARLIRAGARAERATLSAYLRKKALGGKKIGRRILKKNPISGLVVDATPGPVVSQAEIDAALAEYP